MRRPTRSVNFGAADQTDGKTEVTGKLSWFLLMMLIHQAKREEVAKVPGDLEGRLTALEERSAASLRRIEGLLSSLHSTVLSRTPS